MKLTLVFYTYDWVTELKNPFVTGYFEDDQRCIPHGAIVLETRVIDWEGDYDLVNSEFLEKKLKFRLKQAKEKVDELNLKLDEAKETEKELYEDLSREQGT